MAGSVGDLDGDVLVETVQPFLEAAQRGPVRRVNAEAIVAGAVPVDEKQAPERVAVGAGPVPVVSGAADAEPQSVEVVVGESRSVTRRCGEAS